GGGRANCSTYPFLIVLSTHGGPAHARQLATQPARLGFELNWSGTNPLMVNDFLSDRRQHVRLGKHVSDPQTISTGSPQDCVLSPLLFSLYTNSCTSSHQSVKLLKFADDTTLIGLISGGDESAY